VKDIPKVVGPESIASLVGSRPLTWGRPPPSKGFVGRGAGVMGIPMKMFMLS
jgi:hypothetical protein